MNNESIAADVIAVIESGLFKTEHIFGTNTDLLGILIMNAVKTKGTFTGTEDFSLDFEKIHFWKNLYELKQGGAVIASAAPRGPLSRFFTLGLGNESYALFPGKGLSRTWTLKDSRDQILCEIKPRGVFKRGALFRILNQLPITLLVFSYCLVSKSWQDQSVAAAA
ncbi:MAG: hypothetical protein MUO54_00585 [Anaerolineales bacterium]|nr:hypothetical protein [Anaerolineales bacterium]